MNMVTNRGIIFLYILIFSSIAFSCEDIDYKSMEVNHLKGSLEILDSKDFIIDSLIVFKDGKEFLSIGLIDKMEGDKKIRIDDINISRYKIYVDSLKEICGQNLDSDSLISGDLRIFIRKKGVKEEIVGSTNFKDIQSFNYRYIPCSGEEIVTIKSERKYK